MPPSPLTPIHVACCHERNDPLFSVVFYVNEFGEPLDVSQLAAMRHSSDTWTIPDVRHGHNRGTAGSAWK